jgi:hypothetical protein
MVAAFDADKTVGELSGALSKNIAAGKAASETDVMNFNDEVRKIVEPALKDRPDPQKAVRVLLKALGDSGLEPKDKVRIESSVRAALNRDAVNNLRPGALNIVVQFINNDADYRKLQVSPSTTKAKNGATVLENNYGLGIKSLIGAANEADLRQAVRKAVETMGDSPDARTLIYLPKSMEGIYDTVFKKPDERIRVQLIDDVGDYPDVMTNLVLGLKLLCYDRLSPDEKRTPPQDLLNLLAATTMNEEGPRAILDNLFKRSLVLQMKRLDFKDIAEWKRAQDAILTAL